MSTATKTHASAHRGVASPRLKSGVFALAGSNSMATTWFFLYIYFYTRDKFGFDTLHNFLLAAGLGFLYSIASLVAGRYAQRAGYLTGFRLGAGIMIVGFLLCSQAASVRGLVGWVVFACAGQCFTWPALEALMSEGERPSRLRGLVGIYNVTWAVSSAVAYFTGGAMQKRWGVQSMFYVPAAMLVVEILFSVWLERQIALQPPVPAADPDADEDHPHEHPMSPIPAKTFLLMSLLANPLAYLSINTILPAIPALAERLNLTKALAGVVCSVWMFSRAGAFLLLWLWPRWHYRFRYLAWGFALMIVCFCGMLLAQNLFVLLVTQVVLGLSFGLMYHSSLFYSMDVGEAKGEHGGIHESAIGAGNCGGPAIAALALSMFPAHPDSGIFAVGLLLLCGLAVLFWLRFRKASTGQRCNGVGS